MKSIKYVRGIVLSLVVVLSLTSCGGSDRDSNKSNSSSTGKSEGGYKVAWSTIYLTPSWMQQTKDMFETRAEKWKSEGVISKYTIANANGDTSQQIAQIENLIAQDYDALILIAGSSTALNTVVEKAYNSGMVIVNMDSLVTTDKVTSKINTSQVEYGELCAEWMMESINGKGKIIVFNGPAGVSVSDERNRGAKKILSAYPDIEVVAELNSEYNEGPAMDVIMPALDANSDIDGIIALGGSLASASLKAVQSKDMDLLPITGENYNAFLKGWHGLISEGFSSIAVGQPNWLMKLSVDQCIRALQGKEVNPNIIVPIPIITNGNIDDFVPNDFADDGYPVSDITEEEIEKYLK